MSRQTRQPDQWIVLDDGEVSATPTMGQLYFHNPQWHGKYSMVNKVLFALESGLVTGDALVFVEDDDFVYQSWLAWCEEKLKDYDMVGQGSAYYYHVGKRWWSDCKNVRHASLCQTAITRRMFEPLVNTIRAYWSPFFDTRLWILECRKYLDIPRTPKDRLVIGIKGMPGLLGYSGEHKQVIPYEANLDFELEQLREWIGVDAEAYRDFYHKPAPEEPVNYLGTVEVHILCFNEKEILPYTLRHYQTYATKIIVHDGGSTDGSREIAKSFGAEVKDFNTQGKLNDGLAAILKNTCWRDPMTDADWVICVDCDELIYFPNGAKETLAAYWEQGESVIKPFGFEMFSETMPTSDGQIYDEIKHGASDDKWYGKPVLFTPHRILESGFGGGAHESRPYLKNGRMLEVNEAWPKPSPACYLLHYHQIGPAARLADRYDAIRARYSEVNLRQGWGNMTPGKIHVQQKRDYILPRLQQVILDGPQLV